MDTSVTLRMMADTNHDKSLLGQQKMVTPVTHNELTRIIFKRCSEKNTNFGNRDYRCLAKCEKRTNSTSRFCYTLCFKQGKVPS